MPGYTLSASGNSCSLPKVFFAEELSPIAGGLEHALPRDEPALVHVPVGEMPDPWPLIMLPRVRGLEDSWRRNLL